MLLDVHFKSTVILAELFHIPPPKTLKCACVGIGMGPASYGLHVETRRQLEGSILPPCETWGGWAAPSPTKPSFWSSNNFWAEEDLPSTAAYHMAAVVQFTCQHSSEQLSKLGKVIHSGREGMKVFQRPQCKSQESNSCPEIPSLGKRVCVVWDLVSSTFWSFCLLLIILGGWD